MTMLSTIRNASIAASFMVLGLPLLLGIFLSAKLVHGEVLSGEARLNCQGRRYRHWRFRTAPPAQPLPLADKAPGRYAAYTFPGASRLGILLYRTRADQLPGLWNVLVGDIDLKEFLSVFAETAEG